MFDNAQTATLWCENLRQMLSLCAWQLPRLPDALDLEGLTVHGALKTVSYLVLGLMGLAIIYAACIAVIYWAGISV